MELGQEVIMFRCQIDPMVGPIPKNAFVPAQCGMKAHLLLPVGVYVKVEKTGREHIVPFANIQSIELAQGETKKAKTPKVV